MNGALCLLLQLPLARSPRSQLRLQLLAALRGLGSGGSGGGLSALALRQLDLQAPQPRRLGPQRIRLLIAVPPRYF